MVWLTLRVAGFSAAKFIPDSTEVELPKASCPPQGVLGFDPGLRSPKRSSSQVSQRRSPRTFPRAGRRSSPCWRSPPDSHAARRQSSLRIRSTFLGLRWLSLPEESVTLLGECSAFAFHSLGTPPSLYSIEPVIGAHFHHAGPRPRRPARP